MANHERLFTSISHVILVLSAASASALTNPCQPRPFQMRHDRSGLLPIEHFQDQRGCG